MSSKGLDAQARERPRFKASIQPVVDPDDGLFLLREHGTEWLSHPVFADLAPLLDGTVGIEDVFSRLKDRHSSGTILAALKQLERQAALSGEHSEMPGPTAAFWEHADISPSEAVLRITQCRVQVVALGSQSADMATQLLDQQGLRTSGQGNHMLVIADDYLHPELARINAECMSAQRPWLLVKPSGAETWLGPAITPGHSACWECLAHRLRWHKRVEEYVRARNPGASGPQPAHLPSTQQSALAEAVTALTRWIGSGGQSALADCVMSTDTATLERTRHHLNRRPHCPACGTVADPDRIPDPLILQARPKVATSDGGHRGSDPAETLKRLERHLSPITGIVGALDPGSRTRPGSPGSPWLTPTYSADHNFSDMHDARFVLRDGMRRRSGGKGKTPEQARASALAESLERYCGVFDGSEPRKRARMAELGDAALHPNNFMLYSAAQYACRDSHNRKDHKAHWVPEPFNPDAEIEWTPIWSLTHERYRYLPTSMCYFGYQSEDPVFARGDSNGCAVGSVMEEAILQALLELVERDAVAIWWYNKIPRPGVDLTTSDDPYVAELVAHYETLGRSIWVLDVTGDLEIPTFAAISRRMDKPEEDIIYGFGCHLDPKIALSRALTETGQSLDAVPALHRPETAQSYLGTQEAVHWWRSVRVADNPHLLPDPLAAPIDLGMVGNQATDDLGEDVRICIDRLEKAGIEVLALDQSRPDVEFPAVRVAAPGLRHFWARFGPGRLYDIPVKLGWLESPKSEDQLNTEVVQF